MNPDCVKRDSSTWPSCRCNECVTNKRRLDKLCRAGYYTRVTPEQAWKRLAPLIDAGWTTSAIASAAGMRKGSLDTAVARYRTNGYRTRFGPRFAAALASMGAATDGQVSLIPSRRKLRALARIGWGLNALVLESGVKRSTLAMIRSESRIVRTAAGIDAAIDEMYRRLHMTAGPSKQARDKAEDKGWPSPLAFEDINDQSEKPTGMTGQSAASVAASAAASFAQNNRDRCDEVAIDRAMRGEKVHLSITERRVVVQRAYNDNWTTAEITERTGITAPHRYGKSKRGPGGVEAAA